MPEHIWAGIISIVFSAFISVFLLLLLIIIAAMRKGSSALKSKPKRLKSITTTNNPQETLKTIIRFAQQSNYKISVIDETKCQLVLDESLTFTSWGFFYPIFVSQSADNTTMIEVGIKSKLIQVGPIVSGHHERCVNGIKAALFAQ